MNIDLADLCSNRYDSKGAQVLISIPCTHQAFKTQMVLVDDNTLVGRTWKMAAAHQGIDLEYFENVEGFNKRLHDLEKATAIFFDSELGDGVRGEHVAKDLFDQGYKNITLVTGREPSEFAGMDWIKEIKGKEFPL